MNGLARAVAISAVLRLPLGAPSAAAALGTPLGEPALVVTTVAQADAYRASIEPASVAVSGDGRYVAFTSCAQLAPADTNHQRDVYVLDRTDGRVTLESRPLPGGASQADSEHPSISADGQWLVYSVLNNVVVRDRRRGETTFLSEGREPVISGNGAFVAFTSTATALLDQDVHLLEIGTGVIRHINVDASGAHPPTGSSIAPSVSADGRFVAFLSTAPFGGGSAKPVASVYIHDTQLNTTKFIGPGSRPAISADGRYVAFVSASANLVPGDRNNSPDVFLADLQMGSIELISRSRRGGTGNGASTNPAVAANGRFIAFQSEASDLMCAGACAESPEDINLLWDVFLFDRQSRRTVRVSSDPSATWMEDSSGPAIDEAGAVIAFSSRHPIDAYDKANDFDLFIRQLIPR
jgi:Tol biopolymer transport system component